MEEAEGKAEVVKKAVGMGEVEGRADWVKGWEMEMTGVMVRKTEVKEVGVEEVEEEGVDAEEPLPPPPPPPPPPLSVGIGEAVGDREEEGVPLGVTTLPTATKDPPESPKYTTP